MLKRVMKMAIPQSLKDELRSQGDTVKNFAKRHDFSYHNAYMVLQRYWGTGKLPLSAEGQKIMKKMNNDIRQHQIKQQTSLF
jgi:hypothetical protein